jgi:phage RecT family recombinase
MSDENNKIQVIARAKSMMPEKDAFNAANSFAMNYGQEAGFAVMAIQNNPYLLNCTPESMKAAIVSVALTGISLNPALKYAYLVPRKKGDELRAVLDISYMGMIKILTDAGAVKSVSADVVCENDDFNYSQGSTPHLNHTAKLGEKKRQTNRRLCYRLFSGRRFSIRNHGNG